MPKTTIDHRPTVLGALVAASLLLCGCATGQRSLLAGHDTPQKTEPEAAGRGDALAFEQAAPDLIAASGNALLPGSRRTAAAGLLAPEGLLGTTTAGLPGQLGPAAGGAGGLLLGHVGPAGAGAAVNATLPLATGALATNAQLSGPLLGVGGQGAALLGATLNLGAPGAAAAVTANVDVGGGAAPATAAARLLATAGGAVAGGALVAPAGAGAAGGTAPVTAPVLHVAAGVPGTVPLPAILDRLKAGLLGR